MDGRKVNKLSWVVLLSSRKDLPSCGSYDTWVSHRKDKRDDTGWETPKNLGCLVNSKLAETGPCIFEDEATGQAVLYFTSNVSGKNKIYSCQMLEKETVGWQPNLVAGLNLLGANDGHAFIRRKDGLEVIFYSDYPYLGAMGKRDLYVSTRPTTLDPWSAPINLGPNMNSSADDVRPSISWDGVSRRTPSIRRKPCRSCAGCAPRPAKAPIRSTCSGTVTAGSWFAP